MDLIRFEDTEDLAKTIYEGCLNGLTCAVAANPCIIEELVRKLITLNEKFYMQSVYMDNEMDCCVLEIGDDYDMWICNAKAEDEYVTISSEDVLFVHSDVNSKFVKLNKHIDNIFEFQLEDEECDECCETCIHNNFETESDKNHISQTWSKNGNYFSRSFFSTDDDLVADIIKEWTEFAERF